MAIRQGVVRHKVDESQLKRSRTEKNPSGAGKTLEVVIETSLRIENYHAIKKDKM